MFSCQRSGSLSAQAGRLAMTAARPVAIAAFIAAFIRTYPDNTSIPLIRAAAPCRRQPLLQTGRQVTAFPRWEEGPDLHLPALAGQQYPLPVLVATPAQPHPVRVGGEIRTRVGRAADFHAALVQLNHLEPLPLTLHPSQNRRDENRIQK